MAGWLIKARRLVSYPHVNLKPQSPLTREKLYCKGKDCLPFFWKSSASRTVMSALLWGLTCDPCMALEWHWIWSPYFWDILGTWFLNRGVRPKKQTKAQNTWPLIQINKPGEKAELTENLFPIGPGFPVWGCHILEEQTKGQVRKKIDLSFAPFPFWSLTTFQFMFWLMIFFFLNICSLFSFFPPPSISTCLCFLLLPSFLKKRKKEKKFSWLPLLRTPAECMQVKRGK